MKYITIISILIMAVVTSCDVSDPDPDDPLLEDTRPREEFTEFLKLMDTIVDSFGEDYYGKVATIRGTVIGYEEFLPQRRGQIKRLYIMLKTKIPNLEFWVDVTSIADRLPGPRDLYLKGSKYNFTVRIGRWQTVGGPGKEAGGLPVLVERRVATHAIFSTIDFEE